MNTPAFPLAIFLALALPAHAAGQAPATTPHWSTFFGGTGFDDATAICRGPGNLLTIVGTTQSPNLATTGAYQTAYAGNADGFVARFDPSRTPGQQLLWCTYFGGSGMELVFDVDVDAVGNVTFAGCTTTTGPSTNGPGDAFLARLDANGNTLLNLIQLGGSNYDHITDVARMPNGAFAFVGVTVSTDFPATPGSAFPTYLGGNTDTFVGVLDWSAAAPIQWATHLGGSGYDGFPLSDFLNQGGLATTWQGHLKRQAVTVLPNGSLAVVTTNQPGSAMTTAGIHGAVYQATSNGLADIYYVELSPIGALQHATLIGGGAQDWPKDIAVHPAGGVVIAGRTYSNNLPATPGAFQRVFRGPVGDAFVMRFDPSQPVASNQMRYCSYVGGDGGEDLFTRIAVESSGLVTLVGVADAGGANPFPTTRGCLRPTASASDECGAIVRMQLEANAELVYSTLLGISVSLLHGIVLDDLGDAFVVGRTDNPNYPLQSPWQATFAGPTDAVITHLPLLPGGTTRHDFDLAAKACAKRLYAGTLGAPFAGNSTFAICATNAPPAGLGVLGLGFGPPAGGPLPFANMHALVAPAVIGGPFAANALGFASYPLPIPPGLAPGFTVHTQWVYFTNPACPGSGMLSSTERLVFTTF